MIEIALIVIFGVIFANILLKTKLKNVPTDGLRLLKRYCEKEIERRSKEPK